MRLLALDTATEGCSVALDWDGRRISLFERVGRHHTEALPRMVQSVLSTTGIRIDELEGLICGVGPGSFSGVRVGVAYAKGMAAGLAIPLACVSSLALLAQQALRVHSAGEVLTASDARMDQVYFGLYDFVGGRARSLIRECVCNPDRVPSSLPNRGSAPVIAMGSGWARYRAQLRRQLHFIQIDEIEAGALPDARDALDLIRPSDLCGYDADPASVVPRYLRNRVAMTRQEQEIARMSGK